LCAKGSLCDNLRDTALTGALLTYRMSNTARSVTPVALSRAVLAEGSSRFFEGEITLRKRFELKKRFKKREGFAKGEKCVILEGVR